MDSDYQIASTKHQLIDAIDLNREVELSPKCGRNIDASLTSIDIALSPNLGVVSKESSHPLRKKDVRT